MKRRDVLWASAGAAGGAFTAVPSYIALRRYVSRRQLEQVVTETENLLGIPTNWSAVRGAFPLDRNWVHMSGMLFTSHPDQFAKSIQFYRNLLDANPALAVDGNWDAAEEARVAAAFYIGDDPKNIALTGSTTMSLAIAINGVALAPGLEILLTTHDHAVSNRLVEVKAQHSGASVRRISLYEDEHPENASEEEVLRRLEGQIRPETRVFLATWVHSKNGVKLPIRAMSQVVDRVNATRNAGDRVVFVVDGVHGFGVEDVNVPDLGCDFFAAGTHKWIFGPRGTGMLWGNPRSHDKLLPLMPAMGTESTWGQRLTPGGFHAFEHQWALPAAFDFHLSIGKRPIQERVHELNSMLKEGLSSMAHVRLYTPRDPKLSSAIVCFDVAGMGPQEVVNYLRDEHHIVATKTPYDPTYARLTPGLWNDEGEINRCLNAIESMA